jgi:preprotein translocase subunit SecF
MKQIDFMQFRKAAYMLSGALILLSAIALSFKGINLGLDFTGGSLIEIKFLSVPDRQEIKKVLLDEGYTKVEVQNFGNPKEIVVRFLEQINEDTKAQIELSLAKHISIPFVFQRVEYMGSHVGKELWIQGMLGLFLAFIVIIFYLSLRFQLKFSISAIAALFHDVIIVLGLFSILGLEFNLTVLAALLAIIGYSLNDSIVVSDRIRENFRAKRKSYIPINVINYSLTQVLGRTIITSLTTLLVILSLLFVGGQTLQGFAIAMFLGILCGSYSSIYIVSNLLLSMKLDRDNLVVSEAEKSLINSRP